MLLKFPKLLRKQYLNHSPIWNAHLDGKSIDLQAYKLNTKLFSAYAVLQIVRQQSNQELNKMSNMKKINDAFRSYYNQIKVLSSKRGDVDQPLQRVNQYLQILHYKQIDIGRYLEQLSKMYQKRRQQQKNAQQQLQNNQKQEKYISSYNSSLDYVPDFIHEFVRISREIGIDDIDLIILETIPMKPSYLKVLIDSKLQWNEENMFLLKLFKQILMKFFAKGNYDSFVDMKILLNRFINAKNDESQKQVIDIFIQSLNSLISSGKLMRNVNLVTMKMLYKQKYKKDNNLLPKIQQQRAHSYLQILVHQYLLYMNWLCMKCLYRSSSGSFIVNLQQFCQKIEYCDLSTIIKQQIRKLKLKETASLQFSHNQIIQLSNLNLKSQLCKLQIITYLYNQITQATGIKNSKLRQFNKQQIGIQTINKLRSIKIEKQKLIEKLCDINVISKYNGTQRGYTIQNIDFCIKSIVYVANLMNVNCQYQENCDQIFINNQIILNFVQKCIAQLVKIEIILLSQQQKETMYKFTKTIIDNHSKNNKIMQYHKKLAKYIQKKVSSTSSPSIQNKKEQTFSIYRSKKLWKQLKNYKPNSKILNNLPFDFDQIKNDLFLLTSKSKIKNNASQQKKQNNKSITQSQKEHLEANNNIETLKKLKKDSIINYFFN